jgi:hypothetical protein
MELYNKRLDTIVEYLKELTITTAPDDNILSDIVTDINTRYYGSAELHTRFGIILAKCPEDKIDNIVKVLRAVNNVCFELLSTTNKKLIDEITDILPNLLTSIRSTPVIYRCLAWDEDIIKYCEQAAAAFSYPISYYRKNVARNSQYLNWLLANTKFASPETNKYLDEVEDLMLKSNPKFTFNYPWFEYKKKSVKKETRIHKGQPLQEYYIYNQILKPKFVTAMKMDGLYCCIEMKKFIKINKVIITNSTNLSKGIIYDKLILKYGVLQLQKLFNKSIIHGDVKVDNMVIDKRRRIKCLFIDYENTLDLKDPFFLKKTKKILAAKIPEFAEYKIILGQHHDQPYYSYKNDLINLVYAVAIKTQIVGIIRDSKFYNTLVQHITKYENVDNKLYKSLVEIINYYIITDGMT